MLNLAAAAVALALGLAEPTPPTPPTPPSEPSPPTPSSAPDEPEDPADVALEVEDSRLDAQDVDPEPLPEPVLPPPFSSVGHTAFVNTYGLTAGISYFPSFDSSFFFGRALRERCFNPRRWALGYQVTLSVGGAERYLLGLLTLRHSFAAYTYSASGRIMASAALGVGFFVGVQPAILEGEGRIAYVFGKRRDERRLAGLVGGVLRLGWHFHTLERIPMPQVGAFIGFAVR